MPTDAAQRDVLLLTNLGTPDAPTAQAVRRYLAEFLSDRRVVPLPRWLWLPLLHGLILPRRSPRVARKYAEIWLPQGSPLLVHTAALAEAVQRRMPQLQVRHAMRYGAPSLRQELRQLREAGTARVLVLPLYPQYSTTTTASVEDVVAHASAELEVRTVTDYHADPGWVAAVADSIRAHWRAHGRGERLLFSFHGIPQRLVDAGDPYAAQCEAGVAAILQALGMPREDGLLAYQSRFGRAKWLQPDIVPVLRRLAGEGVRTVDVVCPGFATDCLETLEEIAQTDAALFRAAGGEALRYIPCLNAGDAHADALAAIARREFEQWH